MPSKVAIITGGSRGLGKNTALKLAAKGIAIILTYQNNQIAAEKTAEDIKKLGQKAIAMQLDIGHLDSIQQFVSTLPTILKNDFNTTEFDYLINNAGIGIHASFAETTEAQFDLLMNIHLKGTFFLTQELLPFIREGGKIIHFSSGLTRFSLAGYCAYAMMKGGIEVMTRYLAKELGTRKICVNTIAPGAIETDFGGGAVRDNPEINAYIASQTALNRAGLPDDIGNAIALLISEESNWITGQRLEVSGGMFL